MSKHSILKLVVGCVAIGQALQAHDPHDPFATIAVSPNYAQDQTVIAASNYLSVKEMSVYILLESTDGGVNWSVMPDLPNIGQTVGIVFSPNYSHDQPEFPFWLPVSQHRTPARAAPAHTLTHVNLTRPAWPPEAPSLPVWVSPKHGTASCPKRSIAHLSVPLVSSPRF